MKLESSLPILLQPVDSPRRDLEAKIVQAAFNASAGFTTVIGKKGYIAACQKASRNAFWAGRLMSNDGRTAGDLALCDSFEKTGTSLLFHHDEGAFHAKKTYRNSIDRIHPLKLWSRSFVKKFMVWGDLQKQICLDLCPQSEPKLCVTGTPRFDLYGSAYQSLDAGKVSDIEQSYGTFILFCTQFKDFDFGSTEIKPFSERHAKLFSYGFDDKIGPLRAMIENWRFCGDKFAGFLNLIFETASSFSDSHVVIRVHPSEDASIYDRLATHFSNISVLQDGDIRPYLRAAKVVVHSESTTGVEALMASRFTVNWTASNPLEDYAIMGAGEAGIKVYSIKEGLKIIEQGLCSQEELPLQAQSHAVDLGDFLGNMHTPSIPLVRDLIQSEAGGHGCYVELPKSSHIRRMWRGIRRRVNTVEAIGRTVPFREFSVEQLFGRIQQIPGHGGQILSIDDNHVVITPEA